MTVERTYQLYGGHILHPGSKLMTTSETRRAVPPLDVHCSEPGTLQCSWTSMSRRWGEHSLPVVQVSKFPSSKLYSKFSGSKTVMICN